jgi:hypothetical protein
MPNLFYVWADQEDEVPGTEKNSADLTKIS